jgi:general secretion pathway protein L
VLLLTPAVTASAGSAAASSWHWARSADGQTLSGQGLSTLAELAQDAECVLVVPPWQLSWHRVALPKVAPARLRAALEGMLEEHLLEDPALLHFALAPGFRPGQAASSWVAACRRDWLQAQLQALEQAGRPASRIVPAACPQPAVRLWLQDEGGQGWGVAAGPQGVLALPLGSRTGPDATALPAAFRSWLAAQLTPETRIDSGADATHLAQAEQQWPDQHWTLATAPERWLQSLRQGWNLAQFDLRLATPGRGMSWLPRAWRLFRRDPAWRPVRWSLAALLGLQLLGLNLLAWQEKRTEQAQATELKTLLTQTFPQVRLVLDAPRQMRVELERLRQQQGELGGGDLESLLAALGSANQPVAWKSLEFSQGQARLAGMQASAETQQALQSALQARGWRAEISGSDWRLEWEQR